jgi:hypothetical protein
MENCWEITRCGRQAGGFKVEELGECAASVEKFGHSCWGVAGTLCDGEVQGSTAKKDQNCQSCQVYRLYNRRFGSRAQQVITQHPDEEKRCRAMLVKRLKNLGQQATQKRCHSL